MGKCQGRSCPGGTCTNVGCIPSKALLQSSEHFEHAGHAFKEHGIDVAGLSLNLPQMLKRKETWSSKQRRHPVTCSRKTRSPSSTAAARFAGGHREGYTVNVTGPDHRQHHGQARDRRHRLERARELPGAPFDEKLILSNTGALAIDAVPGNWA
jgi:dihydrolipoamide dehydrogenase